MVSYLGKKIKFIFISCPENNYLPYIFKRDFLFCLFLGLLIMRLAVLPFLVYFPKSAFFAKIISYDLIALLNSQRQTLGLSALKENSQLKQAAELKAQDMLDKDYFSHQSPEGLTGWYWIKQTGYAYQIAGENLAIGFIDSSEVHRAWNESSLHRQNLLRPDFIDVGIAVAEGDFEGSRVTVVVQLFGTPKQTPQIVPAAEAKESETPLLEIPTVIVEPEPVPAVSEETPQGQEPALEPESTSGPIEKPFEFNFWGFLIDKYNQVGRQLILAIAALLVFILLVNFLIALIGSALMKPRRVAVGGFMPRVILMILGLGLLSFLDKSLIIQIIPHSLEILSWSV